MENTQANTGREYPVLDALVTEFKHVVESIDRAFEPSEQVAGHFRQARIEFLKGVRQILDNRIEDLERRGEGGTKINVE
jgi:hypothetical protein